MVVGERLVDALDSKNNFIPLNLKDSFRKTLSMSHCSSIATRKGHLQYYNN